jgi:hypothetical protein
MKSACDLWKQLGDVPVDDNGYTQQKFLDFAPGTDREEIWHWFEETFDCSITELSPALKEPVSDARKYHLVSVQTHGITVEFSAPDEMDVTDKAHELKGEVIDDMFLIEVDPAGEIEIRLL